MEPWYRVVTPRMEVREGRSFNPDEFAIHLDQVVSGRALGHSLRIEQINGGHPSERESGE